MLSGGAPARLGKKPVPSRATKQQTELTALLAQVPAVGTRIRVEWPAMGQWFEGMVDDATVEEDAPGVLEPIFHVVYTTDGYTDWRSRDDKWEVLETAAPTQATRAVKQRAQQMLTRLLASSQLTEAQQLERDAELAGATYVK
jgi:hypothetical protein